MEGRMMHRNESTMNENIPIRIRVPAAVLEHVKQLARKRAAEFREDVAYTDLLREAIVRMYPLEDAPRG